MLFQSRYDYDGDDAKAEPNEHRGHRPTEERLEVGPNSSGDPPHEDASYGSILIGMLGIERKKEDRTKRCPKAGPRIQNELINRRDFKKGNGIGEHADYQDANSRHSQ